MPKDQLDPSDAKIKDIINMIQDLMAELRFECTLVGEEDTIPQILHKHYERVIKQ
jgi:hypothetical protein